MCHSQKRATHAEGEGRHATHTGKCVLSKLGSELSNNDCDYNSADGQAALLANMVLVSAANVASLGLAIEVCPDRAAIAPRSTHAALPSDRALGSVFLHALPPSRTAR